MAIVEIPRTVVNPILRHAQGAPESEVCGLIARGEDGMRVYPVANVAEEPERLFAMDPQAQIEAMRRMREAGEALFGIYHSHPHGPAAPSPTDLRQAAYPEALYLVVSLDTEGVLQMRGFRLGGEAVEEVELEVV